MKMNTDPVIELIKQLSFWMDGIQETCRIGGDVLDNIQTQAGEVKKMLTDFQITHLTRPVDDIVPDDNQHYLKQADKILAENKSPGELTKEENTVLLKAKLYGWIKRVIRERKDLPGIEASQLEIYYYVDNILCEWEQYKNFERFFQYTMNQVVEDITNEIVADRSKNSQLKMFDK